MIRGDTHIPQECAQIAHQTRKDSPRGEGGKPGGKGWREGGREGGRVIWKGKDKDEGGRKGWREGGGRKEDED